MKKLTPKQENFCLKYLETASATVAYEYAYNTKKMKRQTIANSGYKLLQRGYIRARIDELQKKAEDAGILNFKQILKMLSERAIEELNGDGLKAIEILNKMQGYYEKDNKQSSTEITLVLE